MKQIGFVLLSLLLVGCQPPAQESEGAIGIGSVKVWVGTNQGLLSGGGYYAGATVEHSLPIYNSFPEDKEVQIFVEPPPRQTRVILADGSESFDYQVAPPQIKEWVTISDSNPIIPAKGVKEVMVTLKMPQSAEVFAQKWEFRVTVVAVGQGTTETAASQRWLINMR